MKLLLLFFFFQFAITYSNAQEKSGLKNEKDSASYAAGLNEGDRMLNMLQQAGADTMINQDLFLAGFIDMMHQNPKMDSETTQLILASYFGKFQEQLIEKRKKLYEANKAKGTEFLAKNTLKNGIITTSSGLQYEVLKKGKGSLIKMGDKIKVHYTGKLMDGSLIDSSVDGDPLEIELSENGLIPGWIEALQLMKNESHFIIYIPYEIGYGEEGKDPEIPPYSVLVFDLEVVEHILK